MKKIRSARNAVINQLGGAEPKPELEQIFASRVALAPLVMSRPRRQYRRGPFYLKIEGLTGPRPKYDEFGRTLPDA